eukprot:TRINITY_DN3616_c0_g1_i3.p1 TRINITY_DN3616_c0_g1~~TRINITY_DN3616_c0_g1_i3.p1  ORF type:complete len:206 (+),score=23.47 TRINITY_DN3616_c0_g1_i3:265-882(+)
MQVCLTSSPEYGCYTWDAAQKLCRYLSQKQSFIASKSILEMGCGTGLCGIVAAMLGADCVYMTDKDHPTHLLDRAKDNIARNMLQEKCHVFPCNWGQFNSKLAAITNIDLILGADVFFDKSVFQDLLETVAYVMHKHPKSEFWFSYQVRSENWSIAQDLERWGLESWLLESEEPIDRRDALADDGHGSDEEDARVLLVGIRVLSR